MNNEKIINGVKVFFEDGNWYCDYDEYIKARKNQGKSWSEKSFCNWCNKHNLITVG